MAADETFEIMLVDVKPRLDEPGIRELIGYSVFPDQDLLERVIQTYKNHKDWHAAGLEGNGKVFAFAGYTFDSPRHLHLRHIAVDPLERGKGYGRVLIAEVIEKEQPKLVFAETDEEAVDFYRSLGFEIVSLGEQYPGVERFRCTYYADEE